jgi:hypothetical protein
MVDSFDDDDPSGARSLFNKVAIVVGLKGFDLSHGPHAELHPIYAIALRTDNAVANELTPEQRKQRARSLHGPVAAKVKHVLVAKRVPSVPAPARPPVTILADTPGPIDKAKQARDEKLEKHVCELLQSHPQRPEICKTP